MELTLTLDFSTGEFKILKHKNVLLKDVAEIVCKYYNIDLSTLVVPNKKSTDVESTAKKFICYFAYKLGIPKEEMRVLLNYKKNATNGTGYPMVTNNIQAIEDGLRLHYPDIVRSYNNLNRWFLL